MIKVISLILCKPQNWLQNDNIESVKKRTPVFFHTLDLKSIYHAPNEESGYYCFSTHLFKVGNKLLCRCFCLSESVHCFRKNSYLTVYIAAFIEYLADGIDEALAEFTAFMGSDFSAAPKDSAHYMMNFINAMICCF